MDIESTSTEMETLTPETSGNFESVDEPSKQYYPFCCKNAYLRIRTDWRKVLKALALGQVLSLMLTGSGTMSQLLQRLDFYAPTSQSFFIYFILGLVFGSQLAYRYPSRSQFYGIAEVLRHRTIPYIFVALVDVEANYFFVRAYHFTSMASIQLIDGLAIVSVVLLSLIFLRVRYGLLHYIGVVVGIGGTVSLILADAYKSDSPALNAGLGDGFAVVGAILYGVSNICEEYLAKKYGSTEFRAMLGIFGAAISGIQVCILERDAFTFIDWSKNATDIGLLCLGYTAFSLTFYICTPIMMRISSALLFTLSLLSADLFSLILGIFLFDFKFPPIYFLSIGLIVTGLILYSWKDPPITFPATSQNIQ